MKIKIKTKKYFLKPNEILKSTLYILKTRCKYIFFMLNSCNKYYITYIFLDLNFFLFSFTKSIFFHEKKHNTYSTLTELKSYFVLVKQSANDRVVAINIA